MLVATFAKQVVLSSSVCKVIKNIFEVRLEFENDILMLGTVCEKMGMVGLQCILFNRFSIISWNLLKKTDWEKKIYLL